MLTILIGATIFLALSGIAIGVGECIVRPALVRAVAKWQAMPGAEWSKGVVKALGGK